MLFKMEESIKSIDDERKSYEEELSKKDSFTKRIVKRLGSNQKLIENLSESCK